MALKVRPKIGLLLFQSQWFKNVGLTSPEEKSPNSSAGLSEFIGADAARIRESLAKEADIVATEPVSTEEEACRAAREFVQQAVDLVLVCPLVWSEDQPLLQALPLLRNLPLALWCYSPRLRPPAQETLIGYLRNCGVVGALQFVGAMKKWNYPFEFVFGPLEDAETRSRIMALAGAAGVRRQLRSLTVGLLPSRSEEMTDIYVDESNLRERFGLRVKYVSVARLSAAVHQVAQRQVEEFVKELKARYAVRGADDPSIHESARLSLGLKKVAEQMKVDILTVNESDAEVVETFGLRPGFYPWMFSETNPILALEGDLACTAGLAILGCLTGDPVLMGEILNFDLIDNTVVVGHVGPLNPRLAQNAVEIAITPDLEMSGSSNRYRGATLEFIARPGRATLLGLLATPKGFRMLAGGGESLGGSPRLPGMPHGCLRLDAPVRRFFEQVGEWGASHHWALVHGNVIPQIEALTKMLAVDLWVAE